MSEHEARGRAVYDHTNDEPRPSGRRRRQVADWGVGDEVFDHMPRRRFGRAGGADQSRRGDDHDEPPIPRGGADDGRRTIVIGEHSDLPPVAPQQQRDDDETFTSRKDAMRARAQDDALWGGDEPFAPGGGDARRGDEPFAPGGGDVRRGGDEPFARAPHDTVRGGDDAFAREHGDALTGFDAPSGSVSELGSVSEVAFGGEELAGEAHRRNGANRHAVATARATRSTEVVVRGPQGGRRTVKIGGRPGEIPRSVDRPRRPPRTVGERLGARPDRVAAWAFALGLVLILVAILTGSAG
jgi:hypothetical protein